MSARGQSLVLLLFGAALVRLATTDALLRYVRPVARPWVLLAGVAVAALALWSLFADARSPAMNDDVHAHRGASRIAWLVMAPVIAVLVIAPPALGAYAATRIPVTAPGSAARDFPPLRGGDGPVQVTLLDFYARAAFDGGATLARRRIELTGFVLRSDPDGFRLARLVITCCAADARAVVASILTRVAAPRPDSWVTVAGTYAGTSPVDRTVPMLRADTVTSVTPPDNPYD